MSRKLVIVESPAKAKTINKILGRDYTVKASMGHVRDLPEKDFGVDIERDFKPRYVTIKSREKVLREIKQAAAQAEEIFLAPDPDREGEAIAWHLQAALKAKNDARRFCRVTYNEITAPAIRRAFAEPREIDARKVDAQQARRVLDRIVGYQVSPLLWRQIRGASSAGRVQSVALRLVCEREREISGFQSEEYWLLGARVRKFVEPRDEFVIRLARINGEKAAVTSAEQARAVRADLEGRALRVAAILRRELSRRAPPAFITSSLQQAASSRLGYTPKRTMQLAQKLYEGQDFGEGPVGLITYMRTDSVALSPVAIEAVREYIGTTFGTDYVPETPHFYKSKAAAQEAHEAIRPTDVHRTPDALAGHLPPDELKLYRLIWERFVACQMVPARIAQRTAEIDALPRAGQTATYRFRATASDILFSGYMKLTGADERKEPAPGAEDEAEAPLPPLAEGEELEPREWLEERKETQPPPRYTEASLIKALEENGVGRPSTYAATISVILDRHYVDKDKRALFPTDMGFRVNDFLVKHLPNLFDVTFTATMEGQLDEIEEGRVEWHEMLRRFYGPFREWLQAAKGPPADAGQVGRLLDLLGHVREWAPAVKRGKRTYSDEAFAASVREQLEEGKALSQRQFEALKKTAARYRAQVPEIAAAAAELGLDALPDPKVIEPPTPETLAQLEALSKVQFQPPRKVGRKTYDDRVFAQSLKEQAEGGRGLSPNQQVYLLRLLGKYRQQIPEAEGWLAAAAPPAGAGLPEIEPWLAGLRGVTAWKPPVERRGREWDDRKFFESLDAQYRERRSLSPRQVAALRKLALKYKIIEKTGGSPGTAEAPAEAAPRD